MTLIWGVLLHRLAVWINLRNTTLKKQKKVNLIRILSSVLKVSIHVDIQCNKPLLYKANITQRETAKSYEGLTDNFVKSFFK